MTLIIKLVCRFLIPDVYWPFVHAERLNVLTRRRRRAFEVMNMTISGF